MKKRKHPYEDKPKKHFWSPAVAKLHFSDIEDIWTPKFIITKKDRVITFGSCFAQHIGRALRKNGFNWYITEKAPLNCNETLKNSFNYEIFSARTGNIYTTSLLKQWTEWSLAEDVQIDNDIWQSDNRFYDPFRPVIEPQGFESPEEVRLSRQTTIKNFREAIKHCDVFVFTLGLTESWYDNKFGYEYPLCPGTTTGEFIDGQHIFRSQKFNEIYDNLKSTLNLIKVINENCKFLLTVSPVPLTATNTNNHVLVATMHSKSILRAVAGQLASELSNVDYFPSYEIINSPVYKGSFFEPNLRSVNHFGVEFVMKNFFDCLTKKYGNLNSKKAAEIPFSDVVCEEELLNAFGE